MLRLKYHCSILVLSILFGFWMLALGAGAQPLHNSPSSASSQQSNELVLMTVTVTDERNRVIRNLAKDRFIVLDGKIPQQVSFFEEKDAPVSVGFLLDFPGSMKLKWWNEDRLNALKRSLLRFIQESHQSNEYFNFDIRRRARGCD